jgi:hypothetical protein
MGKSFRPDEYHLRIEVIWEAREFLQRLDYMRQNRVKAGWVKRPGDWRWSSHNNFGLDNATLAACPIQIDDVHLPDSYQG